MLLATSGCGTDDGHREGRERQAAVQPRTADGARQALRDIFAATRRHDAQAMCAGLTPDSRRVVVRVSDETGTTTCEAVVAQAMSTDSAGGAVHIRGPIQVRMATSHRAQLTYPTGDNPRDDATFVYVDGRWLMVLKWPGEE